MKTIKRRLLSLVLAMAMVLTLAPGALAENSPDASGGNPGDTTPPTTPPALSNITVNGGGDNKKVSETYSLTVSPTPTDAANVTYGWSVSSGGISVSAGSGDSVTVSCKNTNSTTDVTGVVKCTATQDSITKEKEITLTFKGIPAPTTPVATGVTITPTTAVSVEVGKDTNLTATVAGDTGVSQTVTWSSDNSSIAAVNPSTGVVTGKAVGTAKITATSEAKDANYGNQGYYCHGFYCGHHDFFLPHVPVLDRWRRCRYRDCHSKAGQHPCSWTNRYDQECLYNPDYRCD